MSAAEVRVNKLFVNHFALKELASLHPSVQGMKIAVVRNKVWKSPAVKTKLVNLSCRKDQARQLELP